ncbi:MAG: hypothetical protein JNJ60_16855, partial [Rhodocyclaceae bacterium]|nr:hypothetical protein [Rhodocyclaceae bacterium]
ILGLGALPGGLTNDKFVLMGDGGSLNLGLKVHASSDIANEQDADGVSNTFAADIALVSDSKITIDAGSVLAAPNITLTANAKSTGGLVKGILADATSTVTVMNATLTAAGGTVRLEAKSDVNVNEDGDNIFGNGLSVTVVTSFNKASVQVGGTTQISADKVQLDAAVNGSLVATPNSSTVRIIEVLSGFDASVHVGDTASLTGTTSVDAKAHTDAVVNAYATPGSSNNNASFDAAIVNVNVLNSPLDGTFTGGSDVTVDGSAQINNGGGTTTLRADDKLVVTSEADGNVVGTAGATLAINTITNFDTRARISGNAAVTAATLNLAAESLRNVTAKASSTPGGASGSAAPANSGQSQSTSSGQALSNNNASTGNGSNGGGSIQIAGAIAVNVLGSVPLILPNEMLQTEAA